MSGRSPGSAVDVDGRFATSPHQPAALRLPLPPGAPIDPFALAGATGVVLADGDRVLVGLGRARTFDLPRGLDDHHSIDAVTASLAALPCDDRLAAGPGIGHPVVAVGALPFDRTEPAHLLVPALTYVRTAHGVEWVTLVDAEGAPLPDPDDPSVPGELRASLVARAAAHTAVPGGAGSPQVVPRSGDDDFERTVASAVEAIRHQELVKVVLARAVDVRFDADVDVVGLLKRWGLLEPNCTLFSVPTPDGQFVGASPELLVERQGHRVRSRPLAGTTDRFPAAGSGLPPVLLDSAKDGEEHRLVVEGIRADLGPVTTELHVPDRPELVHLHTITHLGTSVDGTLRPGPDGSVPTALHLVARLHPTPAVGGVPREAAASLIERLETTPRGTYAGPLGWVDGAGDGRWVVGIRALTVDGASVRMTAGVGIVAGSDPATELLETGLKFKSVFDALAPGTPFATAASG